MDLVGNVTVAHTQVQRDYEDVQKEKLMESQAKPFQQVWSYLEKVCSNEFFCCQSSFLDSVGLKSCFQKMKELAALASPRPLLLTFTNGAQADFVKVRGSNTKLRH